MENATKALLIAGSVLIAILLIAVGLRIFSSTNGTTEATKTTMEATAITTFNSQFVGFLNRDLTVVQVNSLEQKVIASNAVNKGKHEIDFTNSGAGKYKATYENGYIKTIVKE